MYTNFTRAMVKISLVAVMILSASVAAGQVQILFEDDFEGGDLTKWVGKSSPTSHSGVIVVDPKDAGNNVLKFNLKGSAGDIFSTEVTIAEATTYTLVFDYLGLAKTGSVANDLGGTVGFAEDTPGGHRWLAGTRATGGIEVDLLVDDGEWQTYSIPFNSSDDGCCGYSWPPSGNTIRVMLEDFSGSGGVAGDAYFDNIVLSVLFVEGEAPVGTNILFFNSADDEESENPLTAAYQEVITAGTVTNDCCRVLDTREGAGKGKKYGDYLPRDLDLGDQIFNTTLNPTCVGMPFVDSNQAVLRPWQRGTLRSKGIPDDTTGETDPDDGEMYRENELGVCVLESTAETKGVFFSEEEAANVLGYSVDCAEKDIEHRPFTGAVATDPTELDSPNVNRTTAECNRSRSAKKGSNNLIVLNLRHYTKHNATKPYLSRMAGTLLTAFQNEKDLGCVDGAFIDDLASRLSTAKQIIGSKKSGEGDIEDAIDILDDATLLALFAGPDAPTNDPYGVDPNICAGNPKGLFVGRLMALKHATCSERLQDDSGDDAQAPTHCAIRNDIRDELPPLP